MRISKHEIGVRVLPLSKHKMADALTSRKGVYYMLWIPEGGATCFPPRQGSYVSVGTSLSYQCPSRPFYVYEVLSPQQQTGKKKKKKKKE